MKHGRTKPFYPTAGPGKSDNGFARIAAQPLLEPLLNMHTSSYMSVITYLILRAIPAIHEMP